MGGLGLADVDGEKKQEQKQILRLRRRMTTKMQREKQPQVLLTHKECASPLRMTRFFWRHLSLRCLGNQVDGAEDARRDGADFVEVLHLEAVAVFFYEGFVVVGRECGPGV